MSGQRLRQSVGQWQQSLDLTAEQLQSRKNRGASLVQQTLVRFNTYNPLVKLRRYAEARKLLDDCQVVRTAEFC
jgi:hypothetical protein